MIRIIKTLPECVFNYIYFSMKCVYDADYKSVEHNILNSKNKNLRYIGTYFPRSFIETYNIYANIFSNKSLNNIYYQKNHINMLNVGCGTGGDTLGFLFFINDKFRNIDSVNIYAIDANESAILLMNKIINKMRCFLNFTIKLNFCKDNFDSISFYETMNNKNIKCDFIQTSKMLGENCTFLQCEPFYIFCKYTAPLLDETGLITIIDVTTKNNNGKYIPKIMNKEISKFTKENLNIHTMLPNPCRFYEKNQSDCYCFTQKNFEVYLGKPVNKTCISKITYRVLTTDKVLNFISCCTNQEKFKNYCYSPILISNLNDKNNDTVFEMMED